MTGLVWLLLLTLFLYFPYQTAVKMLVWILRPLKDYLENRDTRGKD